MEQHRYRVDAIAKSVKNFYSNKQKFRINHGSTNSTRSQVFRDNKNVVDTSQLNHVLSVDADNLIALVEPNVPMDRLVEATLKHDCIPPVVMDFPGITAGGGYAGTGCESSSFKHGWFDHTIKSVEMVLSNGHVVTCSKDERPDLFHGAAGALGTLGVVTLVELRLEKAMKYVETTYHPVSSFQEAVERCQEFTAGANYENLDYVDGILFSETSGAIITGRRTNDKFPGMGISRFSAPSDPWYAWHVKDRIAGSRGPVSELIPLPEYLFRYDRGAFWMGHTVFEYSNGVLPFNKRNRQLLDKFMHTRMLYAAAHAQPVSVQIVQDMAIPYSSAVDFLEWVADSLDIWPLWLCPLKQSVLPTLHPHVRDIEPDGPALNIGIWGAPKDESLETCIGTNQQLEQKLHEIGGMKWMYGVNFQNEDDYWRQFDREWYNGLREKYHASWMPSVYDKATTDPKDVEKRVANVSFSEFALSIFPGTIAVCLYKAWRSGAWRYKKESTWPDWVPREEK